MGLVYFEGVNFFLAVNKLVIKKTQIIFLIDEHSSVFKYSKKKLELVI